MPVVNDIQVTLSRMEAHTEAVLKHTAKTFYQILKQVFDIVTAINAEQMRAYKFRDNRQAIAALFKIYRMLLRAPTAKERDAVVGELQIMIAQLLIDKKVKRNKEAVDVRQIKRTLVVLITLTKLLMMIRHYAAYYAGKPIEFMPDILDALETVFIAMNQTLKVLTQTSDPELLASFFECSRNIQALNDLRPMLTDLVVKQES